MHAQTSLGLPANFSTLLKYVSTGLFCNPAHMLSLYNVFFQGGLMGQPHMTLTRETADVGCDLSRYMNHLTCWRSSASHT